MLGTEAFEDPLARDWESGTDVDGTVRLAVVGCGGFARRVVLPSLADADYCELAAVVSGDPEKRARLAADHDAAALDYEEYEAGAATDAYDAVYVATPNRLHLPHVRAAADHGKDVLCEKPLEATADRADRVVEACEAAGVRLMIAYRMQADPLVRSLRAFVRGGGIGEVVRADGEFSLSVLSGERGPDQWRLDPDLAGGGALFDLGVYPLNTARFVLDGTVTWVDGATRRAPPIDAVDEHADFRVGIDGAVGAFAASFSGHLTARFGLTGTTGAVRLTEAFQPKRERRLVVDRPEGRAELVAGGDEVREEFDYFAHALLADRPIEPDGADGARDVRLLEAVDEAADAGTRVET